VLDGVRRAIRAGFAVFGPAGTNHNIINTGSASLKENVLNLHVWFATTGKKNPAIKKAGKGHYKL
jgi:mannose-6-phosphate isomerase-like protein (cupin superfamily)